MSVEADRRWRSLRWPSAFPQSGTRLRLLAASSRRPSWVLCWARRRSLDSLRADADWVARAIERSPCSTTSRSWRHTCASSTRPTRRSVTSLPLTSLPALCTSHSSLMPSSFTLRPIQPLFYIVPLLLNVTSHFREYRTRTTIEHSALAKCATMPTNFTSNARVCSSTWTLWNFPIFIKFID